MLLYGLNLAMLEVDAQDKPQIQFTNISIDDGLANSTALCTYQDSFGYIWFGTAKGLNRYDGYNFKSWELNVGQRYVGCFLQINANTLLFGTGYGLGWYDYALDTFRFDLPNRKNPYHNGQQGVSALFMDKNAQVWIGCHNGVCKITSDEKGTRFRFFDFIVRNELVAPGSIYKIVQDAKGVLWVLSSKGLWHLYNGNFEKAHIAPNSIQINEPVIAYDAEIDNNKNLIIGSQKGIFKVDYDSAGANITLILSNLLRGTNFENSAVHNIEFSTDSLLWFDTDDHGVFVTQVATLNNASVPKIFNYQYSGIHKNSIASNRITHIYSDRNDIVWITTADNGISRYDKNGFYFSTIIPNEYVAASIPFGTVTALLKDQMGLLWVAVSGKGLYYQPPQSPDFFQLHHPSLTNTQINKLFANSEGDLFAVVYSPEFGGLIRLVPTVDFYHDYRPSAINIEHLSDRYLPSDTKLGLYGMVDSLGVIYYSSANAGLFQIDFRYNRSMPDVHLFTHRKDIRCFDIDSKGMLWFGGNNIYRLDPSTGVEQKIRLNRPIDICIDKEDNIWFATTNHGIIRYNYQTDQANVYVNAHGLANKNVMSIEIDAQNNIWIATLNGISLINSTTDHVRNFNRNDGLINLEFAERASFRAPDGTIFLGGKKGIDYFHPNNYYKTDAGIVKIVFTELTVNGKAVKANSDDPKAILNTSLYFAKKIVLHPEHEQFTIAFTDLSFSNTHEKQYRYRLKETEKYWHYCGVEASMASYGKLPSGTYTLLVESTNKHGHWNQNTAGMKIIVKPRFYESGVFRGAMVALAFALSYLIVLVRVRLLKQQKLQLELKVEQRTIELKTVNEQLVIEKEKTIQHQEQTHQLKLKFFTNISHEFRTPLTLINIALDQMKASSGNADAFAKNLKICHSNTQTLLSLVNEIMDFRKLETGHTKLKAKAYNLHILLNDILEPFYGITATTSQKLIIQCDTSIEIWVDKEKFSKIIHNIISNALKHTGASGQIQILASASPIAENPDLRNTHHILSNELPLNDYIEISIEDNGAGISMADLHGIFNRFYQSDNLSAKNGTGIGLEYTKQLMLLHRADIFVSSTENTGTRFSLRFPKGTGHLKAEEIFLSDIETTTSNGSPQQVHTTQMLHTQIDWKVDKTTQLLIVEDNDDLREFLVEVFNNYYTVIEANNGQEGLDLALEHIPDLILSDVMMPKVPGTQLCKTIKEQIETCHIPVILLTAQTSIENQKNGLLTGADIYIPKPFDKEMLAIQVHNLIATRKNLIHAQRSKKLSVQDLPSGSALDREFLQQAAEAVGRELLNSDFTIEDLAKNLNMSYKTFQRKMKALKGITPSDFIKEIRLDAACSMLKETNLTVSEVAQQTGFYDASHFARLFKERFLQTPTEYRSKY